MLNVKVPRGWRRAAGGGSNEILCKSYERDAARDVLAPARAAAGGLRHRTAIFFAMGFIHFNIETFLEKKKNKFCKFWESA
ncbi:hypothetical protein EVAR_99382_1 [Eumeta japonica]|uniref:Uncharacterized protein n=1 Tax=Eumeta variegata TaxID=151549 RepID=A0A4C1YLT1_EUMVA|nr:hypothetical protein EVAR_99382_1 [Eumeta japonica]